MERRDFLRRMLVVPHDQVARTVDRLRLAEPVDDLHVYAGEPNRVDHVPEPVVDLDHAHVVERMGVALRPTGEQARRYDSESTEGHRHRMDLDSGDLPLPRRLCLILLPSPSPQG